MSRPSYPPFATSLFAFGVVAVVAGAGCGVGGVEGEGNVELVCAAPVSIVGTFAEETAQPVEISGCWPIGTWSFAVTVGEHDCGDVPAPLANYQIRFERDLEADQPDYTWISSYLTDPTDETVEISVTSGGGGLCEADLQIFSADGRNVWNLHPALQADATLNGQGEFMIYSGDARPTPEEE